MNFNNAETQEAELERLRLLATVDRLLRVVLDSSVDEDTKKEVARLAIEGIGATAANRIYESYLDKQRREQGLGPATKTSDPAYALLLDDFTTTPEVNDPDCYICRDPEYAQMGLPLCKPCPNCRQKGRTGHVPADDEECSDCGYNLREHYERTGSMT